MKKSILFIINPISGVGRHKTVERMVNDLLDRTLFDYEIAYTKAAKHAITIAKEAAQRGVNIITAVGGDGSVNEVGQALIGTNSALAILPAGSGNGLARHLKIPMDLEKALEVITRGHVNIIDTAELNGKPFMGMAGIGFDAKIGWEFARFGKRGFSSYLKVFLKEIKKYTPGVYKITTSSGTIEKKALLISFANGSQYGNNAAISPNSDIKDGLLDICILRPFPWYVTLPMAVRLFNGAMHGSRYIEIIQSAGVSVEQTDVIAHIDGEPVEVGNQVQAKINPLSLKVIAP
jgi:diacylglycerol kinase (ATP)